MQKLARRAAWVRGNAFWANPWVIGIVLAALVIRLSYFACFASHLQLSGDEVFYFDKAQAISEWVRNLFSNIEGKVSGNLDLVERGWFLPGMSVLLAFPIIGSELLGHSSPVQFDVGVLRLYMGALNFVCLLFLIHTIYRLFGYISALIVLFISAIFPAYVAFSFTFWGETFAANIFGRLFNLSISLKCRN